MQPKRRMSSSAGLETGNSRSRRRRRELCRPVVCRPPTSVLAGAGSLSALGLGGALATAARISPGGARERRLPFQYSSYVAVCVDVDAQGERPLRRLFGRILRGLLTPPRRSRRCAAWVQGHVQVGGLPAADRVRSTRTGARQPVSREAAALGPRGLSPSKKEAGGLSWCARTTEGQEAGTPFRGETVDGVCWRTGTGTDAPLRPLIGPLGRPLGPSRHGTPQPHDVPTRPFRRQRFCFLLPRPAVDTNHKPQTRIHLVCSSSRGDPRSIPQPRAPVSTHSSTAGSAAKRSGHRGIPHLAVKP